MPYPINQHAHQFNSIQSVPVSFGLWDTALKFLSPGPRNDVTDHLVCMLKKRAGADPGQVKWVNFHPPFSEPPSFFFLIPQNLILMHRPQTPQPGFGSIALLQKFTPPPPPPPFQNPGFARGGYLLQKDDFKVFCIFK